MNNKNYKIEYDAHQKLLEGKRLSLFDIIYIVSKIPFSIVEGILRNIPGPLGFKLRYYFYKPFMKHLGKNVMIDVGVKLSGIKNLSVGDYSFIESYSIITAFLNEITIGKRVHIAPFCIIHANEEIVIEDYIGIAAGVKIFSSTTYPNEKRMSGPTIPHSMMSSKSSPIILEKDCAIYANSILLPGAKIGEGAVVCANSIISKKIEPYKIVLGNSKIVGSRKKVTEVDI